MHVKTGMFESVNIKIKQVIGYIVCIDFCRMRGITDEPSAGTVQFMNAFFKAVVSVWIFFAEISAYIYYQFAGTCRVLDPDFCITQIMHNILAVQRGIIITPHVQTSMINAFIGNKEEQLLF